MKIDFTVFYTNCSDPKGKPAEWLSDPGAARQDFTAVHGGKTYYCP